MIDLYCSYRVAVWGLSMERRFTSRVIHARCGFDELEEFHRIIIGYYGFITVSVCSLFLIAVGDGLIY
jgi:hypothetical protein